MINYLSKIIFILLILFPFGLFAQVDSTFIKKELDEIKTALKEIQSANFSTDTLAVIKLRSRFVKDNTGKSLEIEQVVIYIKNGLIYNSRLFTKENQIYELQRSIFLEYYNYYINNNSFPKFKNIRNDSSEILFTDIIDYLYKLDKQNFRADEKIIILTPTEDENFLSIGTDLNSFIDYRIYSDLFGLLGEEGNGIIQTEVSSSFQFLDLQLNFGRNRISMFSSLKPTFRYSIFDSEFSYQEGFLVQDKLFIEGLEFNKFSFVEIELLLNLYKISYKRLELDYGNIGVDFKYSNVKTPGSEEQVTLSAYSYFMGIGGRLYKYKNYGLDFSFRAYGQYIVDEKFLQLYSNKYYYSLSKLSLFYHPYSNSTRMFFLRFKAFSDYDKVFSQLQFGYKSKLNLR